MEHDENQSFEDYAESYIDPRKVKPFQTAVRWGFYGGLALIALGLIFHLTGIADYSKRGGGVLPTIMTYVIWIGTIVMAIHAHRNEDLGGYIKYGRALGTGAIAGLVLAVIVGVWSYLFYSVIAPDTLDIIKEVAYDRLASRGMSEEEIERASGMMGNFTNPAFLSLTAFFTTAFLSMVIALVAGAILKRDHPME